jgi:hypothetical protein
MISIWGIFFSVKMKIIDFINLIFENFRVPHLPNSQNSIISFEFVDSWAKTFLILYPPFAVWELHNPNCHNLQKSMECEPSVRASKILSTKRERVKRSRLVKKCKNATKFGNCPHFLTSFYLSLYFMKKLDFDFRHFRNIYKDNFLSFRWKVDRRVISFIITVVFQPTLIQNIFFDIDGFLQFLIYLM